MNVQVPPRPITAAMVGNVKTRLVPLTVIVMTRDTRERIVRQVS